jgi:catechol 2,3-dioxygenase-like lactoylglutathione lyase family enzyme
MNMITQFAVITLWAENVPATAHFYRDILDLPLLQHHTDRVHFDVGGVYLAILPGKPSIQDGAKSPRFPVIAFSVKDLDMALRRLQEHQVETPWGIEENEEARWVMFYDPAGNLLELVQFSESSKTQTRSAHSV